MTNDKIILHIVLILFVLILIVLLIRYRRCENRKETIRIYLDEIKSGNTPTTYMSNSDIIEGSKPCNFWS